MVALMQSCHATPFPKVQKSAPGASRHLNQQDNPQKKSVAPCYRSQAGLIFLKASPGKGHLGHSNSFAPIGEAVFRSSADQHACILEHGRRG